MATEVELKYFVADNHVVDKIFKLLTNQKLTYTHHVKHLSNCYFDTVELDLRQLDMGLRVRTCENQSEQTIKTAGIVVGGLHQRPEYNVDIDTAFPQLALFPSKIWSSTNEVESIQDKLVALFNTDFFRETWLVHYQGSEIELAFDQGEITTDGKKLDICELELELISGDRKALFSLAKLLFSSLKLRVGRESKAARGYQLFGNKPQPVPEVACLDVHSESKYVTEYFLEGINHSLQQCQNMVASYLKQPDVFKLAELVDALSLLRHGFWLFEEIITDKCELIRQELSYFIQLFAWVDNAIYLKELMNKTGNYRKKLEYSEQLISQLKLEKRRFPDVAMIGELLHSERFNLLQLELLILILSVKEKKGSDTDNAPFLLSDSNEDVTSFAQRKLSKSLSLLTEAMSVTGLENVDELLSQRKLIHRTLLTGNWFGLMFDQQERMNFRTPWLDMKQGLRELHSLWIIKQQLQKLCDSNEANQKILRWQERKVENLLVALAQSKNTALQKPVYWDY